MEAPLSPPPAPSVALAATPEDASPDTATRAIAAPTPVPREASARPRLTPIPRPATDPIEMLAREIADAAGCAGPVLVTVEHAPQQSTVAFTVAAGTRPVDVYLVDRVARAHGAAVTSARVSPGELTVMLLVAHPAGDARDARPSGSARLRKLL